MTKTKPNDRMLSNARAELGDLKSDWRWMCMAKSDIQYACRLYHKAMRRYERDLIEEQLEDQLEVIEWSESFDGECGCFFCAPDANHCCEDCAPCKLKG